MGTISRFAVIWIVSLAGWTVLSFGVGKLARKQGRTFPGWFFLSLILSPFVAVLILLLLGTSSHTEDSAAPSSVPSEQLTWPGFFVSVALILVFMIGGAYLGELLAGVYASPNGLPAAGAVFGLAAGLATSYGIQTAYPQFMKEDRS